MEIKDAIELLKKDITLYETDICKPGDGTPDGDLMKALQMAIAALKMQIPEKPKRTDEIGKMDGNWEKRCPLCEKLFVKRVTTEEYSKPYIFYHAPYCTCGQKIDWEE